MITSGRMVYVAPKTAVPLRCAPPMTPLEDAPRRTGDQPAMTITHPLYLVLYLIAAILFALAALNVTSARINLVAAGLFAWVLVALLTSVSVG